MNLVRYFLFSFFLLAGLSSRIRSYSQVIKDSSHNSQTQDVSPLNVGPGGSYNCLTDGPSEAYVGDTILLTGQCQPNPSVIDWNTSCGLITFNDAQHSSANLVITSTCIPSVVVSTMGPPDPSHPTNTQPITILVYAQLSGGSFSPTSLTINYNTSPGQLPISAATGGKGSYTYQWQSSPDNTNWSNISGATSANYTPGNLTVSLIYYRRIVTSVDKTAYSNVLTVHVNPQQISGSSPSIDQNYILTRSVLKGGVTTTALISTLAANEVNAQIAYFDGLGRNNQNIAIQAAPDGRDIVTPVGYDALGRQDKTYLPYPTTGSPGSFRSNALNTTTYTSSDQYSFYQNPGTDTSIPKIPGNPFSQSVFETSPLNRAIEQAFPGQTWVAGGSHTIKTSYLANTALDSVKMWSVNVSTTPGTFSTYTMGGNYAAGQLYKTITKDENGKQVITFKDKDGLVILKKVQLTASDAGSGSGYAGWLCTYYIYDDIGNLRAVIQPNGVATLATTNWALNATLEAEQFFRYEYDGRNRLYMKKVPGAAEIYIVLNDDDLPVMTQDGNMRGKNQWLVTVYDNLDRPVQTRLYTTTSSFATLITNATASASYPGQVGTLLTQTHYDDYTGLPSGLSSTLSSAGSWSGLFAATSNSTFPFPQMPVKSTATKGLATWVQTATLDSTGAPGTALASVTIYDDKHRVIQTQSQNITGGVDVNTTEYTWTGQPFMVMQSLQKSGINASTIAVLTKNNFDHAGRIINTEQKVNTGTLDTISVMQYDPIGQLEQKQLGKRRSSATAHNATPLEIQDFQYNSRGWLLGMNRAYTRDITSTSTTSTATTQTLGGEAFTESMQDVQTVTYPSTRFFGFDLGYDKISNVLINNQSYTAAQYNGNIAGMAWKSAHDSKVRKYDFTYDAANRLKTAGFTQYAGSSFNLTSHVDYSVSNLNYDNNGNIQSMLQKGLLAVDTSNTIDNLTYTYPTASNKLAKVADAVTNTASENLGDFQDGNTSGNDYGYDANGNMYQDHNKHLTITYNYLNLPSQIKVTDKGSIYYTYDAGGNKLRRRTVDSTVLPAKVTVTTYIGSEVLQNDTLQFIGTSEGRIRSLNNSWVYDYFLKDHLGNTRMVITDDYNVSSPILEATSYYPFGLQQKGIDLEATGSLHNRYLFNGKELQSNEFTDGSGLELYDFSARNFDPQLGRWWSNDPKADKSFALSPYNYCLDNPLKFFDPDGQIPYPITIRAFAPFASFGYGYHGDDRGYSTSSSVTSRVNQRINFDTDKRSITTNAWSNASWKVDNPSNSKTATPSVKFDEPFTISDNGDAKTFGFGSHVAAGNPLTPPGTPNIDVFSDFSITENKKAGTLSVSGKLTGDNFPSTEAFITDPSGNNLFIGIGQIGAGVGKNTGPFTQLWGEGKDNPITSFNFTITTDKNGNFTGVQVPTVNIGQDGTISVGTKTYSIQDWNKLFTSQSPQQQKQ